ncbi:MAG: relaxase domain-containing protein [Propionibacteriaceae bacterium]|nr:relaxase domain-containing protein [Propionibacteriaceae bacterium]
MAIGLQRLSAGSGYEYLTRHVAALDATGKDFQRLDAYYLAKGEEPGSWWGAGLAGVGLSVGDPVTAEQMRLLFGAGLDPTTGAKLGRAYSVFDHAPTPFDTALANRIATWREHNDIPAGSPLPKGVLAAERTALAREWFQAAHPDLMPEPRQLRDLIAKHTSHPRVAVAGFDITLSPPKTVSALWAVADRPFSNVVRGVHDAAVSDALAYLEANVLFTRKGHQGMRHLPVRGMIAARFVHRDSRAGDPDLHTHVALANKVQTGAGEWLAIDAKVLYAAKVTLSEAYTASLVGRLRELGLVMVPTGRDGKRPVYEIAGIDPVLAKRWSTRRGQVVGKTAELVAEFEAEYGRLPTPAERLELSQRATLDTRPGKHAPRSEHDQRLAWAAQAEQLLGPGGIDTILNTVTHQPAAPVTVPDRRWIARTARTVIAVVESEKSSWTQWNVRSEAFRQATTANIPRNLLTAVVEQLTTEALSEGVSVPIRTTRTLPVEPDLLLRPDGTPAYEQPSATRYTSMRILRGEARIVAAAARRGGRIADPNSIALAILQSMANREPLNPGQQSLVWSMASSGLRLQLAIAPAGSGKTTAMRTLATAWTNSGGTVIGLAPSAAAAEQLRLQLGDHSTADNLAKMVWAINHREPLAQTVGPGTLVIIDEAGMADTLTLDHVVSWCLDQGASIRLVGDDQQLGAIGAGGVLRDIATTHGAVHLDEVLRFTDPGEAAASLVLRSGDPGALGYYLDHQRIHLVDPDTATHDMLHAWQADRNAGLDALMLAPTREHVAALNAAARQARLGRHQPGRETLLADGNRASAGDIVLTRRNDRTLTSGELAWVRNGDRWHVTKVHRDGSIDVQHLRNHNRLTLPADYVHDSVELGYATTIHTAQGVTADTCHGLLTGDESRQLAYTMLTRGRHANHAWLQVGTTDPHTAPIGRDLVETATAVEILENIIGRDQAPASATTLIARADQPDLLIGPAAACYVDAIGLAAEHVVPDDVKTVIDILGKLHRLTDADAWPALRSTLILWAANGHSPAAALNQAIAHGGLDDARDPAAVLTWRLDPTQASTGRTVGPLPWLPGIPRLLLEQPEWKTYLSARFALTYKLADEVRQAAKAEHPRWTADLPGLDPGLVAHIQLWRAAHHIPETDLRPTGPAVHTPAEARQQRHLDQQLHTAQAGIREWTPRILQAAPAVADDPALPVLAARLARLHHNGYDVERMLLTAASQSPLPDEHPADALDSRITALRRRAGYPPQTWETVTPTPPRHHHEPPRMSGPSLGISI